MAFVCHICGKSFTTSEKLKYHQRCYGEEQIRCHICDEMFTTKQQLGDYEAVLYGFQTTFDYLYEEFNLPMTLKIHVIVHHYKQYFEWTDKTMRFTNAEFTETAHSTLKMSERIHKFKITRKIGTPIHKEMALKSLVWHNSKRAGYVSPNDFRIRKSSPRVWSSPMSSPRIR